MPQVDGLELCQSVKTGLGSGAPYFILLTAKGEISDRLLALETGADDYLVKPCDQGELMARIRAGLRNVTLAREVRRMERQLQSARDELETAQNEVRRLVRMVPKCGDCARVSNVQGEWMTLDHYLEAHAQIAFRPDQCAPSASRSRVGTTPRRRTTTAPAAPRLPDAAPLSSSNHGGGAVPHRGWSVTPRGVCSSPCCSTCSGGALHAFRADAVAVGRDLGRRHRSAGE